jgi:hypothetical protein
MKLDDVHTMLAASINVDALKANLPSPAEFERILRERYAPLLSAEDYARLRTMCGLGQILDGEVVTPRPALAQQTDDAPHT